MFPSSRRSASDQGRIRATPSNAQRNSDRAVQRKERRESLVFPSCVTRPYSQPSQLLRITQHRLAARSTNDRRLVHGCVGAQMGIRRCASAVALGPFLLQPQYCSLCHRHCLIPSRKWRRLSTKPAQRRCKAVYRRVRDTPVPFDIQLVRYAALTAQAFSPSCHLPWPAIYQVRGYGR